MKYVGEDKVCKKKLILDYFGEKQLLIAVYVLTVSLKKEEERRFNLSKEIVALLTIEDLNSREIENKLNKSQRPLSLCCGNF
jgi:ATP-dependent DNA helicase RecQ